MSAKPVSSRTVLQAVLELKRRGNPEILEQLERHEPQLAEYAMEVLSMIHGRILSLGGPAKPSQDVYERAEALVLTCIVALQHHELLPEGDREPPSVEE